MGVLPLRGELAKKMLACTSRKAFAVGKKKCSCVSFCLGQGRVGSPWILRRRDFITILGTMLAMVLHTRTGDNCVGRSPVRGGENNAVCLGNVQHLSQVMGAGASGRRCSVNSRLITEDNPNVCSPHTLWTWTLQFV